MFGPGVEQEARKHASDEYPKESCGIVVDDEYKRLRNTSNSPRSSFSFDKGVFIPYFLSGGLQAIVHSHPDGPEYPSAKDMQSQIDSALPFGIICIDKSGRHTMFWFGDQVPIPPLEGRPFRHGVTDCYAVIRDWYRMEQDILLPEFPRDWKWWENGGDLYQDNLEKAGFERMPVSLKKKEGDVFFMAIRSQTANHAGVYIGNGEILHHLTGGPGYDLTRPSRREPLVRRVNMIQFWARYTGS